MESALEKNGPWLVGDYSLADIAVAPNHYRLDCLGMKDIWESRYPGVSDWYDRLIERPAFKRTFQFSPPAVPE